MTTWTLLEMIGLIELSLMRPVYRWEIVRAKMVSQHIEYLIFDEATLDTMYPRDSPNIRIHEMQKQVLSTSSGASKPVSSKPLHVVVDMENDYKIGIILPIMPDPNLFVETFIGIKPLFSEVPAPAVAATGIALSFYLLQSQTYP